MNWTQLGFRSVPATGVLVRAEPLLHPEESGAWLDHDAGDGFSHRSRLAEAQADLDRLAQGWVPTQADLGAAPLINGWTLLREPGGASLLGRVDGHPRIWSGRVTATSGLIAVDARLGQWARTVSRFYRLGRPAGAELAS